MSSFFPISANQPSLDDAVRNILRHKVRTPRRFQFPRICQRLVLYKCIRHCNFEVVHHESRCIYVTKNPFQKILSPVQKTPPERRPSDWSLFLLPFCLKKIPEKSPSRKKPTILKEQCWLSRMPVHIHPQRLVYHVTTWGGLITRVKETAKEHLLSGITTQVQPYMKLHSN